MRSKRKLLFAGAVLLLGAATYATLRPCSGPGVELSLLRIQNVHDYHWFDDTDNDWAVIMQIRNVSSNELYFADQQSLWAKVEDNWLEQEAFGWLRGTQLAPGSEGRFLVVVPEHTGAIRLLLKYSPPPLFEGTYSSVYNQSRRFRALRPLAYKAITRLPVLFRLRCTRHEVNLSQVALGPQIISDTLGDLHEFQPEPNGGASGTKAQPRLERSPTKLAGP